MFRISVPILLWCWCPTFASTFWKPSRCLVFYSLRFLQTGYRPSYLHGWMSSCSSPDSGPLMILWSYDLLDLADVANVFVTNSIPQSVANYISWSPQSLQGFSSSSSSSYRTISCISFSVPDIVLPVYMDSSCSDSPSYLGFRRCLRSILSPECCQWCTLRSSFLPLFSVS